jgi:hypothetical protein
MWTFPWLAIGLARAADPFGEEEAPPAFFLDAPRFRLDVRSWAPPPYAPVSGDRLCALTVVARDAGIAVEKFQCPDALLAPALAALEAWQWAPTSPVPPGTALLRVSFLWPAADDPRTATFVWPLVAGGQLSSVPPDVVELRADRRCGASKPVEIAATPPVSPVTCAATVRLDWFGRATLGDIGGCAEHLREPIAAVVADAYRDVCPIGQYGVPIVSEFVRDVTFDQGPYRPPE